MFRHEVDATFERLETEAVDEYLDWYYSLTTEWVLLVKQVAGGLGGLEGHLAGKMRQTFEQEKWYARANTAFERLMAANEEAGTAYVQAVGDILERNRVDSHRLRYAAVDVASVASLDEIRQPSFHQDLIPRGVRFSGAAGVGGGVGFIIAKKVNATILPKTVSKRGANAPVKALIKKAASRGLTIAAGLSVIPGLGTAAGAVIGFAASIVVDGVLLKAEEALSRDEFRREIVSAIRKAHRKFKDQMLGTGSPPKQASP